MGCANSKSANSLADKESSSEATLPNQAGHGSASASPSTQKTNKPKKRKGRILQVLVAGYQQSGKSTFFKQLQLIHLNGWAHDDKKQLIFNLKSNIIQGIKELLEAAMDLELHFPDSLRDACDLFEDKNPFDENAVDGEVVREAKRLWDSAEMKQLWKKKNDLPNLSCINLDYVMEHIDRICAPDATPTDEDVLRTRSRTTGTVELEFTYDNKQDFRFVDVGGQKSERRKWSQVIESPDAVLYFTSLPDWDLPIMVDAKKTKMEESLEIWESVVNAPVFAKSTVILFLNKIDLFEEKLKRVPLNEHFPSFSGKASDSKEAVLFIRNLFEQKLENKTNRDTLQAHVTCALDTEQIRTVFNSIRTSLTERALTNIGF